MQGPSRSSYIKSSKRSQSRHRRLQKAGYKGGTREEESVNKGEGGSKHGRREGGLLQQQVLPPQPSVVDEEQLAAEEQ
jgi:hypothetical protein